MEINIPKKILAFALGKASSISDKKNSMPILSNVLIESKSTKQITISATDLNLSSTGIYPATIKSGGAVTVPARTLYEIVKSMPDGDITISTENENVQVVSGRAKFNLLSLSPSDFPSIPKSDGKEFFKIDCQVLKRLIDYTSFSISVDETRPHLNGAFFQGDGKIIRMVSTDGHRLSKAEISMKGKELYDFSTILPIKAINEIKKLVDDGKGKIQLSINETKVFAKKIIEIDGEKDAAKKRKLEITLISKVIEADFPPYNQVIPSEFEKELILGKNEFLDTLKRVSVVSTDQIISVNFNFTEGSLELVYDNPQVGHSTEILDVSYNEEPMTIGVNAKYLIDILTVLDGDEIKLELCGALDPVVVKDVQNQFKGVIMPMRT